MLNATGEGEGWSWMRSQEFGSKDVLAWGDCTVLFCVVQHRAAGAASASLYSTPKRTRKTGDFSNS